ncbi:MAG: Hsp70 family protein [Deltaproteobacteria bacterium]|nr:MAG: Hsp70 family protein [Deltaproteobacteria bacterium]
MKLGIDLGTTRTIVAAVDRGHTPIVRFDDDADGIDAWPTLAATDGSSWVFGPEAARRLLDPGWQGVRGLKRLLGGPQAGPDRRVPAGDQPTVLALLTAYLRALRDALLHHSNLPREADDDRLDVMVAVPAAASCTWRFLTLQAFRDAGFHVQGMLNEPAAAAIEYADRHGRTLNSRREHVLVYDLGGGTFDATVVQLGGGQHRVLAHAGRNHLGGEDLDAALLALALDRAGLEWTSLSPATIVRLLEHCRQVKEGIHPSTRRVVVELGALLTSVERASAGIDEDHAVTLPLDRFHQRIAPLLAETFDTVTELIGEGSAGLEAHGIAGVYVVGGASSLPLVARQLRQHYGRRVHRSPYPAGAVAMGLALAHRGDIVVHDRVSRHLGVFREWSAGRQISFDPVIRPDMPTGGAPVIRRYRPVHTIGHFRFAECDRLAADGTPAGDLVPVGELRVPFSPAARTDPSRAGIAPMPEGGPLVEEQWTVDVDGTVTVRFTDLDSGWRVEHRIHA